MNNEAQLTQFMNNKAGDISRGNTEQKSLDDVIEKIRVPSGSSPPLVQGDFDITDQLLTAAKQVETTKFQSFEITLKDDK